MIEKNKSWVLVSVAALALSVFSLFLPVIRYTANLGDDVGIRYSFNIVKLLEGKSFVAYVLSEYRGSIFNSMSAGAANIITRFLCYVGVAAILLSFIGLRSMAKQYESVWPFVLTLAGIICTAIPATAILIVVLMSGNAFYGNIQAGAYGYATPVAMIVSCIAVTKRHKLTREELAIQKAASAYIWPAGDLPLQ